MSPLALCPTWISLNWSISVNFEVVRRRFPSNEFVNETYLFCRVKKYCNSITRDLIYFRMVHVSNFLAFHYNFVANGPNYPRGNGEGHIPCDFTVTKGSNVWEVIKFTNSSNDWLLKSWGSFWLLKSFQIANTKGQFIRMWRIDYLEQYLNVIGNLIYYT